MTKKLLSTSITGFLVGAASLTAFAQVPSKLADVKDNSSNVRMSIHEDGTFFLGGLYNGGLSTEPPASGPGTRLIWFPSKAAFRAGAVSDTHWDASRIGDYSFAAGQNVIASASNSTAFGLSSTALQQSSFAVGERCTASGAASVAMGYQAHTNARQGSFVFADRSTVDTLRAGVNHSSNWRVSGGFRIFTSSNLSTGVTIQSGASVSNWGQSNAIISSSTGAMLTTAGVWQNTSDVNKKHLFEKISAEEVLKKVGALDIQKWTYKAEANNIKHIGPTSQDFYAAFGLGTDTKSIGTVDADGIALVSIKALEARTKNLNNEVSGLKAENEDLKRRLENLEKRSGFSTAQASLPVAIILVLAILGGLFLRKKSSNVA